jgi:hypothetical protein
MLACQALDAVASGGVFLGLDIYTLLMSGVGECNACSLSSLQAPNQKRVQLHKLCAVPCKVPWLVP